MRIPKNLTFKYPFRDFEILFLRSEPFGLNVIKFSLNYSRFRVRFSMASAMSRLLWLFSMYKADTD